ncbi:hypothetical protein [Deinococcus cellulosilyticus]|uniref:Uncharacterized protein n=1 Tax=Deinococcus cellulosilyticus (strain DSM 18568 / NBRC 106333 / KACC 11606 / 5516J-15) TaxID=1223518 RepID=A0A511N555_DEIC1|nr:hypothetical protein [Deinococcus cellulosilyticus]GEM47607.1 hypothetical protein DC3_32420 [Deinococcus cellulosilyticus NBRC 106333 = KACC 11606]
MKKKAIIIAALLGVATLSTPAVFAQDNTTVASQLSGISGYEVIRTITKVKGVAQPLTDAQLASLVPPRSAAAESLFNLIVTKACLQPNTLELLAKTGTSMATNLLVATAAVEARTCNVVDENALTNRLNQGKTDFSNVGNLQSFLVASANSSLVRDLLSGVTARSGTR